MPLGRSRKTRWDGTHRLLAYADDVNLLGNNIVTIIKHTETLIDPIKEVGREINIKKTKYMLLSRHQNPVKIGALKQFRYLGTTATNQNLI
jgi:hypothetical protein